MFISFNVMTKSELYQFIIDLLPVEHPKDKCFISVLKESLDAYVSAVKHLEKGVIDGKDDIVHSIENTNKYILSAVDNISKGLHHEAFNDIEKAFGGKSLGIHKIKSDSVFYRMRTNESKQCFGLKDMFHIPYDKRGLVKTQRFSMPGYPCLYLGFSLAACWEEMHRPSLDNVMFNGYKLTQDAMFLSLKVPSSDMWDSHIYDYINVVPLIIACMIKVDDYNNPYKVEYTIPQLITEWFISHRMENKRDLLGIEYTSVHINKDFDFPRSIYDNLALPVKDFSDQKYCVKLKNAFVLTKPTSEEIERIKNGIGVPIHNMDASDMLMENYRCSLFGELEEQIKKYSFVPLS